MAKGETIKREDMDQRPTHSDSLLSRCRQAWHLGTMDPNRLPESHRDGLRPCQGSSDAEVGQVGPCNFPSKWVAPQASEVWLDSGQVRSESTLWESARVNHLEEREEDVDWIDLGKVDLKEERPIHTDRFVSSIEPGEQSGVQERCSESRTGGKPI